MQDAPQFKVHVQHIWPDPQKDTLIGATMGKVYEAQNAIFATAFGPALALALGDDARSVYFSSSPFLETC